MKDHTRAWVAATLALAMESALLSDSQPMPHDMQISFECIDKSNKFAEHLQAIRELYVKPGQDPLSDRKRDNALVRQRERLIDLLSAFDEALTEFERLNPVPDEYKENVEKE